MKKTYKMENLECAHCAGKMEQAIAKLPGVEAVSINFMMQKITIQAEQESFSEILKQADECCKSFERNSRILYR